MFLDLVLARVGLIQMSNSIDIGLQEPINSIIWVQPRITDDCVELKTVVDELMKKYGKEHIQQCRQGMLDKHISTKLQDKLNQHSPKKSLVENYLIEIARNYNVEFTPGVIYFNTILLCSQLQILLCILGKVDLCLRLHSSTRNRIGDHMI